MSNEESMRIAFKMAQIRAANTINEQLHRIQGRIKKEEQRLELLKDAIKESKKVLEEMKLIHSPSDSKITILELKIKNKEFELEELERKIIWGNKEITEIQKMNDDFEMM